MSEELLQITPVILSRYHYYKLGNSTLSQLRNKKIINSKFSQEISSKKPDGLIILPSGDVKAVIEYKQPTELRKKSDIDRAIQQELEVAKQLCKLLIVTSGEKTIWINALNGHQVLTETGDVLAEIFNMKAILEDKLTREQLNNFEYLIDMIDYSLSTENDQIQPPSVIDPSLLAKTMWQTIWINTGKEPEKCLYNVVELFMFKFLSDVGVLGSHNNFWHVYSVLEESATEALNVYASVCRTKIGELFPKGIDGTTIINGTIFVNDDGKPNSAQARLFGQVIRQLKEYDNKYGSFRYIKKDFKTRLYESFLRQSAGIRFLGQYFTPRNVVQAMIEMSNISNLQKGARICDPFCGVGGFILESIATNPHILHEFEPINGEVKPSITLLGFDKGTDEKDDQRTIILAKANMLIYFSDLLVKYNTSQYLRAFSTGAFNKVFHLIKNNLGTFGIVNEDPFDLILTNPPYVTSGSSSLKAAIDEQGLNEYYTSGSRGTESLALEWVIRNLKLNGQALVIVPDGLLNQQNMLKFVLDNCIVQGIISLPQRTFYSTPKKTYILILTRKRSNQDLQTTPIFTYLVSEIGESRDARRIISERNDLIEAVANFNQFKGSPNHFTTQNPRCKIVQFDTFREQKHWMVDRWWTLDEKLFIEPTDNTEEITEDEFRNAVKSIRYLIDDFIKENGVNHE